MIDLGLAKRYKDPKTNQHVKEKPVKSLTGTARYASLNAHTTEQSRRDDLESIGIILIYFLKGVLPWQGLQGADDNKKNENIMKVKRETTLEQLCDGCP